ncbi:VirB8/TrbF family protein, partial [Burkholderia multivorans]|uniref:VirB8/TrbF family protein n=1 Tax=Burkholderia multivorans TaxID=87883 RepID=UPI003F7F1813
PPPPGAGGGPAGPFRPPTVDHGQAGRPECFLATIAYQYKPKLLQHEREGTLNPLGFTVTAYSRDADYGVCQDSTVSAAVTPASSTEAQR